MLFEKRGTNGENFVLQGLKTKKAHRKVSLSRCSIWCRHQESNPGPTDYKSVALPTELYRRVGDDYSDWVGSVNP